MGVELDTPNARATVRYLPVSPYKIRQVLDIVRGLPVDDAIRVLQLSQKDAADSILKLLDSAVANAEHNDNVAEDELFVARAFADEGPTLKRGRPRARGRYGRIKKRTSHITIIVSRYDDAELERRRRREAATTGPARVSRRRRVAESRRRARAEAAAAHDHDHDEDLETEELDELEDAEPEENLEDTTPEEPLEAADEEPQSEGSDDRSDTEASDREDGE